MLSFIFSNNTLRNSEAQPFTYAVHCCTRSLFEGEAVSENTQLFTKVNTRIYKQVIWVFCLFLN